MQGKCFCQQAKFTIIGVIPAPWHCYCSNCRKLHGSAYATHTVVRRENFHWNSEQKLIKKIESSKNNFRYFCGNCGSHLCVVNEDHPALISIVCATLDTTEILKATGQIFTASKPSWVELDQTIPQYEAFPDDAVWKAYMNKWGLI
jgi:hypothetical protein